MVKTGNINTILGETPYTNKEGKEMLIIKLLLDFPYGMNNGATGHDFVIAEKIVENSAEKRKQIAALVGLQREFTVNFTTRNWTDPATQVTKYFQSCRVSTIAETIR